MPAAVPRSLASELVTMGRVQVDGKVAPTNSVSMEAGTALRVGQPTR